MKEELHLFIIWENARIKEKEILEDINKNLEIIKVYEVEWSKEKFSNNLSRFYGTNLPKDSAKEVHCGNGKFLLVIVKVNNPIYENRNTSKGEKSVAINMFDKKTEYRELTGGGHKVHATDSEKETQHDLTLLLGKNVEDFLKENEGKKWDGQIEAISKDLFGAEKWNSVENMFYALNNCVNYALLRNYEVLPDEIYVNEHNDIDVICESLQDVAYILNATPVFPEDYRVHYKTNVEDKIAYFDLRNVGDNYYYAPIEKNILKDRIYNEKGFYTLNKENYFYTLLYHALLHKPTFKEDYKQKLMDMHIENVNMQTTFEEYIQILKKWLIKNEYIIIKPIDKSVAFNKQNAEYFGLLLYKDNSEAEDLKLQNEEMKIQIANLKTKLAAIEDSRTWKIMQPIRNIKKLFKR